MSHTALIVCSGFIKQCNDWALKNALFFEFYWIFIVVVIYLAWFYVSYLNCAVKFMIVIETRYIFSITAIEESTQMSKQKELNTFLLFCDTHSFYFIVRQSLPKLVWIPNTKHRQLHEQKIWINIIMSEVNFKRYIDLQRKQVWFSIFFIHFTCYTVFKKMVQIGLWYNIYLVYVNF